MSTYYTKEHEWISINDQTVRVGITDHAQEQLGDIVYIELPALDKAIEGNELLVVVESVKAAGEVHAPLTGTVSAVNTALVETPELVNTDPMKDGWLVELHCSAAPDTSQWMDQSQYQEFLGASGA